VTGNTFGFAAVVVKENVRVTQNVLENPASGYELAIVDRAGRTTTQVTRVQLISPTMIYGWLIRDLCVVNPRSMGS
jgi:hypothetical protein